ncbi:hypothetical protein Bpfe_026312 [Biomphalaria pfeifferi]|uniref:Uncharacterized protein n=1 Tax=Biomphalaria pfeifferi TaxID=112525 RepID=A0AAD8AXQ0_BIOPF|nr:hypothetical protein Bpfe_026312 [Biomphalaria pfeifferi]
MNSRHVAMLYIGSLAGHSINATHERGNKDIPPSPYNYNKELHRVASFRNWPDHHPASPTRLANEGYFYMDHGSGVIGDESVMCHACYTTIPGLATIENISQVQWSHLVTCTYSNDSRSTRNTGHAEHREIRQETYQFQDTIIQVIPTSQITPNSYIFSFQASNVQLTQSPASTAQLTQSSASTAQLTQSPASTVQLTQSPASTVQVTQSPASTVQLTQSPASNVQLTQSPASTVQLTQSPASTVQVTQSPASTVQVTQSPASTVQLTQSPDSNAQITQSPASNVQLNRSAFQNIPEVDLQSLASNLQYIAPSALAHQEISAERSSNSIPQRRHLHLDIYGRGFVNRIYRVADIKSSLSDIPYNSLIRQS